MEFMGLKGRIEKRLEELKLDINQLCQFAWLCGVRALPFLSVQRSFSYWSENNRQKYLYSIFNALDVCAQVPFLNQFISIRAAVGDAASIARIAYNNNNNNFNFSPRIAYADVAYAASEAADTARTTNDVRAAIAFAAAAAFYTALAAEAYAHIYATNKASDYADISLRCDTANVYGDVYSNAYDNVSIPMENIFVYDIKAIKNNRLNECNHDINIYGEAWGNFQEDLKDIGCVYWAELYENLFRNGFDKLDKEELRLRLDVPDEIRAEGAVVVAKHITVLKEQGTADVQRARLILIGSAAAGKTTLARKLRDEDASLDGYGSTHGVDIDVDRDIELNFNGVTTQIWDFGGQVIYHASHRCFMSERCIYVLVVNARKNDDYKDIGKIKYWLDTVKDYAKDNAKVFIVINEEDNRKYNFDDVSDSLKAEYKDLIQNFYSFNIGNDKESLRNFKAILSEYIERKGNQKIGAMDKKALDEIKYMFESGTKLLDKETVDKILVKYGIKDKERALDLFDTLGAALCYDDFDDVVIDPYWITHGIYKVIDYMQDPEFKQPVYEYQFKEIFKNESDNYPEGKLEHIFELMVRYKIGFRNSGVKGLFVPCVAAFYKPSGTTKPDSDNYIVKFNRDESKEYPAGFFDKFIADNAEEMNKRDGNLEFWQAGMVLINKETSALVEMLENREIIITTWGKEKEQYADKLISRLDTSLKEFGYVAVGKEEADIITGKQGKDFKLYSENNKLKKEITQKDGVHIFAENIFIINNFHVEELHIGDRTINDNSITNNFNNCVIHLPAFQGELTNLAKDLKKAGCNDDAEYISEIIETADEMNETIENASADASIEKSLEKKGVLSRIKRFGKDIIDENSQLRKNMAKLRDGAKKLQDIARVYNDIAKLIPVLPQVPDFLLNLGRQ